LNAINRDASVVCQTPRRMPVIFAVLYAAFLVASLVAVPILAPGARIPNPFGPEEASRNFVPNNPEAVRVTAFLQLASAMCLAALGAAIHSTQKGGRTHSFASPLILAGSVGGSVLLAISALCAWALASPGAVDPGSAFRTLQFLPFLMGGPGWAGFFALLMAGAALGGSGVLPRWAVWIGYFLALISALATLVLLTINAAPCLPVARFLGFVWLIYAAVYATPQTERAS
jgi:hypothetical protein